MTEAQNQADQQPELTDQQSAGETVETSNDFGWLDGESEEEAIIRINKETGRNFKNLSDVVKNIQNADETINKLKTVPKESNQSPTSTNDVEELFFESKPEARIVEDDLRTIAESKGISILQAWKQEKWLQDKSQALFKEEQTAKLNAKKVLPPSGGTPSSNDYINMSEEEILNLPPEEAGKAIKAKAGL